MRVYRLLYSAAKGAPKRVTKSTVDWSDLTNSLPERAMVELKEFVASSQALATDVSSKPAEKPAIDFDYYKQRLKDPSYVDKLKAMYEGIDVPYPKDSSNMMEVIEKCRDHERKAYNRLYGLAVFVEVTCEKFIEMEESIPPIKEWTMSMKYYYFPDSMNRLSRGPHNLEAAKYMSQPDLIEKMRWPMNPMKYNRVPPPLGEAKAEDFHKER